MGSPLQIATLGAIIFPQGGDAIEGLPLLLQYHDLLSLPIAESRALFDSSKNRRSSRKKITSKALERGEKGALDSATENQTTSQPSHSQGAFDMLQNIGKEIATKFNS